MSKAEDGVKSLGYGKDPLNRVEYTANDVWDAAIDGYKEGYHQAEKDLELTWKDMMAIDDLLDELLSPRRDSDELVLKGYYEEVLKRFKETKKVD